MRAGDLHGTRTEIFVGIFVGDDRDQPAMFSRTDRNFAQFSDNRRIAFIRRMHRDCTIAQHGFRAGRGDRNVIARLAQGDIPALVFFNVFIGLPVCERIFEVPHVAVDFGVFDLEIGNCRFEMRIPVDQTFAAIDQALVIHVDKNADHGIVEIAVFFTVRCSFGTRHREGRSRPIH